MIKVGVSRLIMISGYPFYSQQDVPKSYQRIFSQYVRAVFVWLACSAFFVEATPPVLIMHLLGRQRALYWSDKRVVRSIG